MNWEAISAISEVVGVIAVIGTLLYLSHQVKSSAKATAGLVRRQIADSAQLDYLTGVESPEFSALVIRTLAEGVDPEPHEAAQMFRFVSSIFLNYEVGYLEYESGLYAEWETVLLRRVNAMLASSPFVRSWWTEYGQTLYSESFTKLVNRMVDDYNKSPQSSGSQ